MFFLYNSSFFQVLPILLDDQCLQGFLGLLVIWSSKGVYSTRSFSFLLSFLDEGSKFFKLFHFDLPWAIFSCRVSIFGPNQRGGIEIFFLFNPHEQVPATGRSYSHSFTGRILSLDIVLFIVVFSLSLIEVFSELTSLFIFSFVIQSSFDKTGDNWQNLIHRCQY